MKFEAITFFPDGSVWDTGKYLTSEQDRDLLKAFGQCVTFDNQKQVSEVETEIGELKLDWVGSDQLGVGASTWWLGKTIVNTGVCLYGNNKDELDILNCYLKVWQEAEFVKELCAGKVPFTEVFDIKERPLMTSVNWAAIPSDQYRKIASFDLSLAAVFFEGMRAISQINELGTCD